MNAEIENIPLPGMPEPEPLWAIRTDGVQGVIPAGSRREAELHKELLDEIDVQVRATLVGELSNAVVIEWPGTPEAHRVALREAAWA